MREPTPRRFARVQPPALVYLDDHRFRLVDLSAGGFGFDCNGHAFRPGDRFKGELVVNVAGVPVTLPAGFEVRNFDACSGRAGVAFEELGEQQAALLLRAIKSCLTEGANPGTGAVPRGTATAVRVPQRAGRAAPRSSRLGVLLWTAFWSCFAVVAAGCTALAVDRETLASLAETISVLAGGRTGP